ncbi:unnamed protein product [Symbiodinium sp. CCMP2592]|nr:unnamed protein product [Symbiodinium sp. CCMP2592]
MSCDPCCWTRVHGVDKGSVVIALVVMNNVMGQEFWALKGMATIGVTGTSEAEEAFLAYLGEVNEKVLDWKSFFQKSGVQRGVNIIHRFRERLLGIDEGFSKWGKEQLDNMRSQQPAEDNVSWPPSLQCPVPNHPLQATPIFERTDASLQNLCRDFRSMTQEAFVQHCVEVDQALQECRRSFSAFKTVQGMSRLPQASEVERSRRRLWDAVANLLEFRAEEVLANTASQATTASAGFPPTLLHQLKPFAVPYDAPGLHQATKLVNAVLREARRLQEAKRRADWQSDVTGVHEMLDSLYSLTGQESTLTRSRFLRARYPENFLRADWPSDAVWVHEMLDSPYSLTVQEPILPRSPLLRANYPEKSLFLRANWPSDAPGAVPWPPIIQQAVSRADSSTQDLCRDLKAVMPEEAFAQHCMKVDRALQECRRSFSAFNTVPGMSRLPEASEVVELSSRRLWEDVSRRLELKSEEVLASMHDLCRDLKSIMAEEAFRQHCLDESSDLHGTICRDLCGCTPLKFLGMAVLGDVAFLSCSTADGHVAVTGWIVELPGTDAVVGTIADSVKTLEHKLQCKEGGHSLGFVRAPISALVLDRPKDWTGPRLSDVPGWRIIEAGWKKLSASDLTSSEAEQPRRRSEEVASGSGNVAQGSSARKSKLTPHLKGLATLFGEESDGSEEDEEAEDDELGKVPLQKGFLPPGGSARKAKKAEARGSEEAFDVKKMMAKAVASGADPASLLPMMLMAQMLEKDKKGRRSRKRSEALLGGSSSDESGSEEDGLDPKGMKAVHTLHRFHEQILKKPRRVIAAFEKEVVEELGVVPGQSWTLRDYVKRQSWGRYKGLFRCAMMDVATYELIRNGRPEAAAAQTIQNLKAKMQAVIEQGDWTTAWLLTGLVDPVQKKEWAGNKQEMTIVSGYVDAMARLKKKVREAHGKEGDDEDEPGRNSDFMKYLTWFEGAQGSLLERSGDSISLFPCALPYPETLSAAGVKGEDEARVWWAKSLMNSFVAWSNFVVLGCPRWGGSAYEPRVAYRSCTEARAFADRLLGEVEEFAASDLVLGRLACEGKRATVEDLLAQVQESAGASYFDGVQAPASTSSPALAVTADRIAVPNSAGGVDPGDWLPEDRAAVFRDLESIRLPEHLWDEAPLACHRVPQAEEADLARKLLETKMAVLVPEDALPRRRDGRMLVGGLFAVAKNEHEDRLIYDRRPENSTMPYLDWATLPSAACFTRLLLQPNQYLRGSGDDLRNFYYNLRLPEGWERFNPVGRRVDARVVEEQGLDPRIHHRLCLRVLGMGDRNGCAIAQATHEGILRKHGGLDPETTLRYGQSAPRGDLWQGVYLDDLLVVQRMTVGAAVPLDGTFDPPEASAEDADMQEVSKAEGAYDAAGLQRALHKSFRALTKFKAWGAEIDGVQGTIASPLSVRQQVWRLLERLVATGWATKEIMQKVLGFLAFAFQFRRELFCLHHRVYNFVAKLPEKKWCRLPNHIVDELRSVALHLPFARWNMRRSLHPSVLATDATPTSGGAVRARVAPELNEELWRRSEIRGAPVRLDRAEAFTWKAEEPIAVSTFASAISECLQWTVTASYSFRSTSHINLQEGRALRREIARMASALRNAGHVQVCLNDSRVIVGAVAKGRSSSYKLNGLLRAQLPYLIFADIVLALLWVETESNLGDHPSRFRSLPPPKPPPRWMSRFGVRRLRAGSGVQIFGSEYFTEAHRDKGLMMWDPVDVGHEASLLRTTLGWHSWVAEAIEEGVITWLWLAPPKGCGPRIWSEVLGLAAIMLEGNGYVFIEHPRKGGALRGRDTQLFMSKHEGIRRYIVDWNLYVDPGSREEGELEQSVVLSNAPWLSSVSPQCPCQHAPNPQPRNGALVTYPKVFCDLLADAALSWNPSWASAYVDAWLERAVEAAFQGGEKLYWATLAVLSIQKELRLSGPLLRNTWSNLRAWRMLQPIKPRVPMTHYVMQCVLVVCLAFANQSSGSAKAEWFSTMLGIWLAFAGMLRPGEVDNLKFSDFCFPEVAELCENVGLVVNIRQAKTRRVWANQFILIHDRALVSWLRWWAQDQKPSLRFLQVGRRKWSERLREALNALDLETCHLTLGTETLRHYLQDALAIHTLAQAPGSAKDKLAEVYDYCGYLGRSELSFVVVHQDRWSYLVVVSGVVAWASAEQRRSAEAVEVRLPRRSDARAPPNSNVRRREGAGEAEEATEGTASAAAEALQSLAGQIKQPLDGGLTATQVLEDPQARAAAARWRAGSSARRLTAVLARARQGLQAWVNGPTRELSGGPPAPVRPRPLRPASRDGTPAEPTSWRAWLPRLSVWTVLLLVCVLVFPRIIAKFATLILRLLGKAMFSLMSNLIQELLSQTLQAATEMEDQVVEYLNLYLGGDSKPVASLPQSDAVATPPAQQQVVVAHPTRPVDLLMLLLLTFASSRWGGVGGKPGSNYELFIAGAHVFPEGGILEGGFGIQSEGPQAIECGAFLAKKESSDLHGTICRDLCILEGGFGIQSEGPQAIECGAFLAKKELLQAFRAREGPRYCSALQHVFDLGLGAKALPWVYRLFRHVGTDQVKAEDHSQQEVNLQLCFVLDSAAQMRAHVQHTKTSVSHILYALRDTRVKMFPQAVVEAQMSAIVFAHESRTGPEAARECSGFTKDAAELEASIDRQLEDLSSAPEGLPGALHRASHLDWTSERCLVIVLTEATGASDDSGGEQEKVQALRAQGIAVVFFYAPGTDAVRGVCKELKDVDPDVVREVVEPNKIVETMMPILKARLLKPLYYVLQPLASPEHAVQDVWLLVTESTDVEVEDCSGQKELLKIGSDGFLWLGTSRPKCRVSLLRPSSELDPFFEKRSLPVRLSDEFPGTETHILQIDALTALTSSQQEFLHQELQESFRHRDGPRYLGALTLALRYGLDRQALPWVYRLFRHVGPDQVKAEDHSQQEVSLQLCFVLDSAAQMRAHVQHTKTSVSHILYALRDTRVKMFPQAVVEAQMSAIVFAHESRTGPEAARECSGFTKDAAELEASIDRQLEDLSSAPEGLPGALHRASHLDWTSERCLVIVLTEATGASDDSGGEQEKVQALRAQGIAVVFFYAPGTDAVRGACKELKDVDPDVVREVVEPNKIVEAMMPILKARLLKPLYYVLQPLASPEHAVQDVWLLVTESTDVEVEDCSGQRELLKIGSDGFLWLGTSRPKCRVSLLRPSSELDPFFEKRSLPVRLSDEFPGTETHILQIDALTALTSSQQEFLHQELQESFRHRDGPRYLGALTLALRYGLDRQALPWVYRLFRHVGPDQVKAEDHSQQEVSLQLCSDAQVLSYVLRPGFLKQKPEDSFRAVAEGHYLEVKTSAGTNKHVIGTDGLVWLSEGVADRPQMLTIHRPQERSLDLRFARHSAPQCVQSTYNGDEDIRFEIVGVPCLHCLHHQAQATDMVSWQKVCLKASVYNMDAIRRIYGDAARDPWHNPIGSAFDLAQDESLHGFRLIILNAHQRHGLPEDITNHVIPTLECKGLEVACCVAVDEFSQRLNTENYHVAWIISTDSWTGGNRLWRRSRNFTKPAEDNHPYYDHANVILQELFGFRLEGNTGAGKCLRRNEEGQLTTGEFGGHGKLCCGIEQLFEGVTICYPNRIPEGWSVFGMSTDSHPVLLCNEATSELPRTAGSGRVVVDCGFTKLMGKHWDQAGTARYVNNCCVWLVLRERFLSPSEK